VEPKHWTKECVRVLSDEDAVEAVNTAKEAALAQHRLDDSGRENRCTGFRLRGVTLVAEAQLRHHSAKG
jgi:hypothetical protein